MHQLVKRQGSGAGGRGGGELALLQIEKNIMKNINIKRGFFIIVISIEDFFWFF